MGGVVGDGSCTRALAVGNFWICGRAVTIWDGNGGDRSRGHSGVSSVSITKSRGV